MQRSLIFALVGAILVVVFAIQNATTVDTLKLWFWEIQNSPLALIILITLALGALLGILVSIPGYRKRSKTIEQLKKRIKSLEANEKKEKPIEEKPESTSPPPKNA